MDPVIKSWQDFLKTSPEGVFYPGPSDGVINPAFEMAINFLGNKLNTTLDPQNLPDLQKIKDSLVKNTEIIEWKKYLSSKNLYNGNMDDQINPAFQAGMINLENLITSEVPSVTGMIWSNNKVNPIASIQDVEEALKLLKNNKNINVKNGVANFDALGPPDAPDYLGNIFNNLFISQEDSKLDEWSPENNQNQGKWQNPAPHPASQEKKEEPRNPNSQNIDDRIQKLTDFMNFLEKSR